MVSAALLRKVASLLLALCVALPLSTCVSRTMEPVGETIVARPPAASPAPGEVRTVVTLYGYELLAGYVSDVRAGQADKIFAVALVLVAFFSPVATMWVREPLRSGAQFLLTFPACYFLGIMTFFATPLYGGMLALTCWAVLLKLSSDTLWASFRARKRRPS